MSELVASTPSDAPLTELEATIAAMATELAGSRDELMRAEQIQTAVVLTLRAAEAFATDTPSVSVIEASQGEAGVSLT